MSYSRNGRSSQRHSHQERRYANEQQFTCLHCSLYVSCDPLVAGVRNRNHCPYCLWSRHLDWREPGDRMSNCRAPMEPVGLTTKWSRNKYASERDGELMIIHCCTGCGKLVINRIAADDGAVDLLALFERSLTLGLEFQHELELLGVAPLGAGDGELVSRRLFGGVAPLSRA